MSDFIDAIANEKINERIARSGIMSLGELQAILDGSLHIPVCRLANGRFPGSIDSYRGSYRFASIDPHGKSCTVAELASMVLSVIGTELPGYKGGGFYMSRLTPVFVSPYGEASGMGLVGVACFSNEVILATADISWVWD